MRASGWGKCSGATSARRSSPILCIARAAAPMLPGLCGRTRMMLIWAAGGSVLIRLLHGETCTLLTSAVQLWVQFFHACRTDAVRKLRFGMLPYIGFDLFPITMIVADVFARGADGQKAAELLDGCQCSRQFM